MAISDEALDNPCRACKAQPGEPCRSPETGVLTGRSHFGRVHNKPIRMQWVGGGREQKIVLDNVGPCAGCRRPDTQIYGEGANPLCWGCREVLEEWRAAGGVGFIPYTTWDPTSGPASPYSTTA